MASERVVCKSGVGAIIPSDWVRRLDVDYPLVAYGSASGAFYVANLEQGNIIATNAGVVNNDDEKGKAIEPKNLQETLSLLYGLFDGGGTIAIAFSGMLICEAGRTGGVHIWQLDTATGQLVSQGSVAALDRVLVSTLHLDKEFIWVGIADGRLEGYALDEKFPLSFMSKPERSWKLTSSFLVKMNINSEIGCAIVTTASGSVCLDDDESGHSIGSFILPFDSIERRASNAYTLSATIVLAHRIVMCGFVFHCTRRQQWQPLLQPLAAATTCETPPFEFSHVPC